MHTHFATNAIRYVGTVPLRVAGGESGEVVEEDVIRGVTYMWKQLKQATKAYVLFAPILFSLFYVVPLARHAASSVLALLLVQVYLCLTVHVCACVCV